MSVEGAVGGEGVHLGVADFDAGGVGAVVEFGVYFQPSLGGCRADEVDDDLVAGQGSAGSVHGDMVEESVFDFVPFAGSGREVADRDFQLGFLGQGGELRFPRAQPVAVGTALIGADQ